MDWRPNKEYLEALVSMGMSACAAEKGLFFTANTSVDAAASWVIDHASDTDLNEPFVLPGSREVRKPRGVSVSDDDKKQVKMVFVVNDHLGMGRGKVASQVAHAALGLYKDLLAKKEKYHVMLSEWEQFGAVKVVLRGSSGHHLMDIEEEARLQEIPKFLVCDVGKTQVAAATITAVALFGYVSALQEVVGDLPTL